MPVCGKLTYLGLMRCWLPCAIPMPLTTKTLHSMLQCNKFTFLMFTGIAQGGLQELTPDISKLTKLTYLSLDNNTLLEYIPESISCLQNLEALHIEDSPIREVPVSLKTLKSLDCLTLTYMGPVHFPSSLEVRALLYTSIHTLLHTDFLLQLKE
jgi:Leucine-rich repeat (LRR) protein